MDTPTIIRMLTRMAAHPVTATAARAEGGSTR